MWKVVKLQRSTYDGRDLDMFSSCLVDGNQSALTERSQTFADRLQDGKHQRLTNLQDTYAMYDTDTCISILHRLNVSHFRAQFGQPRDRAGSGRRAAPSSWRGFRCTTWSFAPGCCCCWS